jgi:glycopeptide antibiotics resistance protein
MIGCGMSVSIELLQYILKRGTTEYGDVIHNTLGCLIGIGLYYLIHGLFTKMCKES